MATFNHLQKGSIVGSGDYVFRHYGSEVVSNPYLTFKSESPFTISTTEGVTWDGTLEYSTNRTTWATWDGTEISSDELTDGNYIFMRGTGNTKIVGDESENYFCLSGSDIQCIGNIENLLDYQTVLNGEHPEMGRYCYYGLFYNCSSLITAPELPATTLADYCYYDMFYGCTALKVSETQTGEYQYPWRIPTSGDGTTATDWNKYMLYGTGGTFTDDPEINTTYYTDHEPV